MWLVFKVLVSFLDDEHDCNFYGDFDTNYTVERVYKGLSLKLNGKLLTLP